ncbi:MAG: hypothetical protein HYU52_13130 [Acidobacteria bacterium]|nr:hypothetical protein [Acidobacteriota bacterium]
MAEPTNETLSASNGGAAGALWRRGWRRAGRSLRKHRFATLLLTTVVAIVFLPTVTSLRLLSPNDVYYHYDPWMSLATARAQNQLIHDPPLSYFTLVSLLRDGESFHWNRHVGGGIPGTGSAASAVLSPFVLIPSLLLPLQWSYTGIVLLKLTVAFWFAYFWLREERLGKRGSAVGAIAFAVAGSTSVWWLWQGTNATALYPALFWAIARMARGKRNGLLPLVLLGVSFLLSGYPAAIAYGVYLGGAYAVVSLLRFRRLPRRELVTFALAGVAALAIAAPYLDPFVGFLGRTGYLESRADASMRVFFPLAHLRALVQPYWLGDPVARSWVGDSALGPLNNFVEVTIYPGVVVLALVALGLFRRRKEMRWFFVAAFGVILALMFSPSAGRFVADLPGLKFSPLVRLRVLLPVPCAFLAAAGFGLLDVRLRRSAWPAIGLRVAWLVALAAAADLALFAAWFHPHNTREVASLPASKALAYLRAQERPFRVAPTFLYMMPNSAQLARLEDIRAHWGAERAYRDLLRRIDPQSVDQSTVITFNSLRMNLDDPVLGMLNARYIIEPPSIDILRYLIQERTRWVVAPEAPFELSSGNRLARALTIENDGVWAIAIPFDFVRATGEKPELAVTLTSAETGAQLFAASFTPAELLRMPILHVPTRSHAGAGRGYLLEMRANGVWINLLASVGGKDAESLAWGTVERPLILERAFKDGRLFRNLAALPRFWATWEAEGIDRESFLSSGDLDFSKTAYFMGAVPIDVRRVAAVPPSARRVSLSVKERADGGYEIMTESEGAFVLSSSEKLTPELQVIVDGVRSRALAINTIFAGVLVPAGRHTVVFERRIGRGWWPISAIALGLVVLTAWRERRRGFSPLASASPR